MLAEPKAMGIFSLAAALARRRLIVYEASEPPVIALIKNGALIFWPNISVVMLSFLTALSGRAGRIRCI